jgi:hypothetical protein
MCLLYTRTTCPEVTVASALHRGIDGILVPRLTAAGERELTVLEAALASVELSAADNERLLSFCGGPKIKLQDCALYKLCRFGGVSSPRRIFKIRSSRAPSQLKVFAWQLYAIHGA